MSGTTRCFGNKMAEGFFELSGEIDLLANVGRVRQPADTGRQCKYVKGYFFNRSKCFR